MGFLSTFPKNIKMNKTKNTVLFSILVIFVFIYVGKNSNLSGTRRYFISLKEV